MYTKVITEPDIAYAMGAVTRYMITPEKIHWKVVKQIFKYLKRTINYAMLFPKSLHFILQDFVYSHWEGDKDIRRSTRRYCFNVN
ncbi:hypothetical protein KP509_01G072100 [Ceratopteris richardii]|uniref:Reverse transcriptase Ty1/copia-type domain-containing protein n=1 Tax=Ceratopteris richardii TaxID=49495 RepID=A0A8T2VLW4_CERRI|nr:hypothetical protein KP509_01G072100 [Ceratopteris richardii]